ncbi:MAG: DNRLRE domain-containing protein [Verrucomicrobiota bacterium]
MRRWVPIGVLVLLSFRSLPAAMITIEAIQDNSLFSEMVGTNHLSNGAGDHLFAGTTANGHFRRALVLFDVAAHVPVGATIDSAVLRMQVTRRPVTSSHLHILHRLTSDWGEGASDAAGMEGTGTTAQPGDTTWQHTFFDPVTPASWTTPGGDFNPTVSSSFAISDEDSDFVFFPSTADTVSDVQLWLDNPPANFGWILLGVETAPLTATRFTSRNDEDGPLLILEFTPIPEPSTGLLLVLGTLCFGRAIVKK